MSDIHKSASDFAEAGGFVACLRAMHEAKENGVKIDFDEWAQSAESILGLKEATFDTLVDLFREFYAEKCKKDLAAAKKVGFRNGRKPKPLPENFDEQVELWLEGKVSGKIAAQACGMPLSTFYAKAKAKPKKEKSIDTKVQDLCEQWAECKISEEEACALLEISKHLFQKLVRENKYKRDQKEKNPECSGNTD